MVPARALTLALLVLALAPAAAAAAEIPTVDEIPPECQATETMGGTAYACDPRGYACDEHMSWCSSIRRGARSVALTLGTERRSRARGIVDVGSSEELHPGETVELRWRTPSSRAVLAVMARGAKERRRIVLALRWRPAWVRVTANADGSLTVQSERRSGVIAAEAWTEVVWDPRSAREAARRIVGALEMRDGTWTGLRTLCAALAPGVAEHFAREIDDEDDVACVAGIYLAGFGGEGSPDVESTTHAATKVRIQGDQAILSTRLTHRYDEGRPRTVTARALLVRGADGVWSLATIWPLLGRWAAVESATLSDRQLARMHAQDAARGRRAAAKRARKQAVRDAATVTATASEPCAPPMRPDPLGDVMANAGPDLSRRPFEHPDADLVETGLLPNCVVIRTAGPLPKRFDVETSRLRIEVRDGRVLAETARQTPEEDEVLITGLVARLEPARLVVQTPVHVQVGHTPHLFTDPEGFSYHDADKPRAQLYGGLRAFR